MMQQAISLQNQSLRTITFGTITHPIPPEPLNRARILQKRKANPYPKLTLPVDSKAAPKQAGPEKSPSPGVQPESSSSNTKPASTDVDTYTAVSNWLATSETFEKPPEPMPIADPAPVPRDRLDKEDWLQISEALALRIQSRAEQVKTPMKKQPDPAKCEKIDTTKTEKTDNDNEEERTRADKEQQQQQQRRRLEVNEAVKLKVHPKAKKLTADATATAYHQERKRYVERRAREIHEGMRLCKPFDMDSLRREFASEDEVRDVKRMVRELGFEMRDCGA